MGSSRNSLAIENVSATKENAMKPSLALAAVLTFSFAATAAAAPDKALDTVDRALQALGGESALRAVRTMVITERAQHWEPNSSTITGGEPRHTGDSNIVISRDFAAKAV